VFLKNERNEASKSIERIGIGRTLRKDKSQDGLSIIARLRVKIDPRIAIRPYDAIYYGKSLGVVLSLTDNVLELIFEASKYLPEEDELLLCEPLILYDSALSILTERGGEDSQHLEVFIKSNDSYNKNLLQQPTEKVQTISNYDLDEEKKQLISELLSMPRNDYITIEGPPGTGKTTLIAAATCEIANRDGNVLIVSHTNVAVDNALERILELNPTMKDKMIRIGHPAKISRKIKPLIGLPPAGESRTEWLKRILEEKKVIGMTIAKLAVLDYVHGLQSISKRMKRWPTFDYVFIDESSMTPLAIALIPLFYSNRWLIVGDTRQLPPIIKTRHKYMGAWSIMELTSAASPEKTRVLRIQRRGNSTIFEVISRLFYEGILTHDKKASISKLSLGLKLSKSWLDIVLNPDQIMSWVQIEDGVMEWCKIKRGKSEGASGVNTAEAAAVFKIYKHLIDAGLETNQIAVITTYRAQANLIREAIKKANFMKDEPIVAPLYEGVKRKDRQEIIDIEIERPDSASILDLRIAETVDSYQGREKPCIIYSITTHTPHIAIQDYRRINVAMTRAKSKLIITSSLKTFYTLPWLMAIKNSSKVVNIRITDMSTEYEFVNTLNTQLCRSN
jgi:DNA replication ATP-dependent helicase Dna2